MGGITRVKNVRVETKEERKGRGGKEEIGERGGGRSDSAENMRSGSVRSRFSNTQRLFFPWKVGIHLSKDELILLESEPSRVKALKEKKAVPLIRIKIFGRSRDSWDLSQEKGKSNLIQNISRGWERGVTE